MSIVSYEESIAELKRIFVELNTRVCKGEIKTPIFSIANRRNRSVQIWFKPNAWTTKHSSIPGIFFAKDSLQCSPYELVNDYLKVMVNLKNHQLGIKDVSSEGYFNKNFKKLAEEYGLEVEMTKYNGWEKTSLSKELVDLVDELKINLSVLQVRKPREKVIDSKYDSLSIHRGQKEILKTFCSLINRPMTLVVAEALEKYMEEFKR